MTGPLRSTKGIVEPHALMRRVRFRRRAVAPALARYVDCYWLIDWDLAEPFEQHIVTHPSVNIVFWTHDRSEVAGVFHDRWSIKLDGKDRVFGVKFRPGGFLPFSAGTPLSRIANRRAPIAEVYGPDLAGEIAPIVETAGDDERASLVDAFLLRRFTGDDPLALKAIELTAKAQDDRSLLRVGALAETAGMSVRGLQRLYREYVGASPKWVIRRYRIHEAVERAGERPDWARLAVDLGYADQAHFVRDFTAAVGVPPTRYGR